VSENISSSTEVISAVCCL